MGILSNSSHPSKDPQDASRDLENSGQLGIGMAKESLVLANAAEPVPRQ